VTQIRASVLVVGPEFVDEVKGGHHEFSQTAVCGLYGPKNIA
jgi:hypothetical protein